MPSLAVIVPAFNEEKSIASVVASVNALKDTEGWTFHTVVVNDSSADTTAEIASSLNCTLLNLPVNLGIGGAVQTGLTYAFRNNFDYAVQMDGDGQHPASQLPVLIKAAQESGADITIGSRFLLKEGFQSSFMRRLGISLFKNLTKFLCGITICDTTSGFRLYNKKAIALATAYYPDEYPEPEAIIYFHLNGLKIIETPVRMVERMGGQSSIRTFSALYYMLKVSLAVVFTFIKFRFSKKT